MKVSDAIDYMCQRRRFHAVLFTLLALNFMFVPIHIFVDLFLSYDPKHYCNYPKGLSKYQWIPYKHDAHSFESCLIYIEPLNETEGITERTKAFHEKLYGLYPEQVWDWKSLKFKTKLKQGSDHKSHKGTNKKGSEDAEEVQEEMEKSGRPSQRNRADGQGELAFYTVEEVSGDTEDLDMSAPTQKTTYGVISSTSNGTTPNNGSHTVPKLAATPLSKDLDTKHRQKSRKYLHPVSHCPNGHHYSDTVGDTLVTEYGLSCEQDVSLITSTVLGVAMVTGAVIFAPFVDRYGRRTLFMMVWCQNCLISLGIAFVGDIRSYWVLRFLSRFYIEGVEISLLVLAVEMAPPKSRPIAPLILYVAYSMGQVLLSLQAMLFKSWWKLQLAISVETFLLIPFSWFLVPESVHWLVSRGRQEDAEKLIRLACRLNGVLLPADFKLDKAADDSDQHGSEDGQETRKRRSAVDRLRTEVRDASMKNRPGTGEYLQHEFHAHIGDWRKIADLLKNGQLRQHFFIVSYIWAIVGFLYYGLTTSTMVMKGNVYLNYCLSGLVMAPGSVSVFILRRFGRKKPIFYFLIGAGIFIILSVVCPYETPDGVDLYAAYLTIKLLAKYCVVSCLISMRLLIIELFPTPVRGTLIGLTAFIGLLGSALGYYFLLMVKYSRWLGVVFGALTILAAILSRLLPETSNRPLPDTINDMMAACRDMFLNLLVAMPTSAPVAAGSPAGPTNPQPRKRLTSARSTLSSLLKWKSQVKTTPADSPPLHPSKSAGDVLCRRREGNSSPELGMKPVAVPGGGIDNPQYCSELEEERDNPVCFQVDTLNGQPECTRC